MCKQNIHIIYIYIHNIYRYIPIIDTYTTIYTYTMPEWHGLCFLPPWPPFIWVLAQTRCTTRCMSAFILCSTAEDGLPEGQQ